MAKKRSREADGATEAPDKMVEDGDSSDDDVSGIASEASYRAACVVSRLD